jgi:hypothetical protein
MQLYREDIPFNSLTFSLHLYSKPNEIRVLDINCFALNFRVWAQTRRIKYRFLYKRKILRILAETPAELVRFSQLVCLDFNLNKLLYNCAVAATKDFHDFDTESAWIKYAYSQMFKVELKHLDSGPIADEWLFKHKIPHIPLQYSRLPIFYFFHEADAVLFKLVMD